MLYPSVICLLVKRKSSLYRRSSETYVSNAVIVIDEPELHLHPELARLLIRTMQSIKPGNQIWLATHNTEIIDERDETEFFISLVILRAITLL